METQIAKIVRAVRKELASRSSTFVLIYTDVDLNTNEILTKVTSNSTPEGISAILSLLLEPTEEAVQWLQQTLEDGDGDVRGMLVQLCKRLTIKGIAQPAPPVVRA